MIKFSVDELCFIADYMANDAYDAIFYDIPIYYRELTEELFRGTSPKCCGLCYKWEINAQVLANKFGGMNEYDIRRLTNAIKNYWSPFYKHDIELVLCDWARNELWNW